IDHLQDLGHCGLLLQRLALLGQQSRVLHRNDCLCREVLEQRNFLIREWPDLLAVGSQCSEQRTVLLTKRNRNIPARSAEFAHRAMPWFASAVGWRSCKILDMDDILAAGDAG